MNSASNAYFQVSQAMSKKYLKVSTAVTVKAAMKCMHDSHQNCVLVVDKDDLLEGILTYGDIRRSLSKKQSDVSIGDSTALDVCDGNPPPPLCLSLVLNKNLRNLYR